MASPPSPPRFRQHNITWPSPALPNSPTARLVVESCTTAVVNPPSPSPRPSLPSSSPSAYPPSLAAPSPPPSFPLPTMGFSTSKLSLPNSHFLAQPRISLPPSLESVSSPPSARPDTTTLASADYDVDVRSGFLPPTEPLSRLPEGPWSVWEEAWDATDGMRAGHTAEHNRHTHRWRESVLKMPVVDVMPLSGRVELLRRARAVLAFLTHVWTHTSGNTDRIVVPAPLAVPFCQVSHILDMPPILTYADTVLYNWTLKDPAMGFVPENIHTPMTFTRTESEVHFYKTSLLIETLGPACLSLMRSSLDEAFVADQLSVRRITDNLVGLTTLTERIRDTLEDMRRGCDPRTFYWEIRPFFNGGSWIMEGVKPRKGDTRVSEEGWRISEFGGPSAGQSTLIHALDVFLGIDHRPRPSEHQPTGGKPTATPPPGSTTATTPAKPSTGGEETFMMRMAAYMPHHHRRFLTHLAASLSPDSTNQTFPFISGSTHSVRSLAIQAPPKSPPRVAYDAVVQALGQVRKSHSRIALLYIVTQSRVEPPTGSAFMHEWHAKMESDRQKAELRRTAAAAVGSLVGNELDNGSLSKTKTGAVEEEAVHKGTGGTDLAKFLKRCRDRTAEALLGDRAEF